MSDEPQKSLSFLAKVCHVDKGDASTWLKQAGLEPVTGQGKNAHLYPSFQAIEAIILQKFARSQSSLEDAKIENLTEDTRLKRMSADEKEGRLADVTKLLEAQNDFVDILTTGIKQSSMTEVEKEDCLGALLEGVRKWADENQ